MNASCDQHGKTKEQSQDRANLFHAQTCCVFDEHLHNVSSNIDPRSLRLNFELDMEIYCRDIARDIEQLIDTEIGTAHPVTLQSLAAIPFGKRLRNRIIWLASPYL